MHHIQSRLLSNSRPLVRINNETRRERILPNVTVNVDQTKLRVRATLEVSMSAQVEPMMTERDEGTVMECDKRQKRLGLLRTDMHSVYDVPFQLLDTVSTKELRRIAKNRDGDYSERLQAEAQSMLRAREDPQDRDSIGTEM